MPFDLRLLESFVVLADELRFGRAAGRLGFAQPALSRQIHRLETQLGIRLFERNAHGVALTAAGDAFRPAAEVSLSAAHAAAHEATSVQRGLSGQLAIAAAQGEPGLDPQPPERIRHETPASRARIRFHD